MQKDKIQYKYKVGDILVGELNVFYIRERSTTPRIVNVGPGTDYPFADNSEEIISSFLFIKDWRPVNEYIVENPMLNQTFLYNERQIDGMVGNGFTLHCSQGNKDNYSRTI